MKSSELNKLPNNTKNSEWQSVTDEWRSIRGDPAPDAKVPRKLLPIKIPRIPVSFTNFVIFATIFFALIAAQIALNMQEDINTVLTVSPVDIMDEVDITMTDENGDLDNASDEIVFVEPETSNVTAEHTEEVIAEPLPEAKAEVIVEELNAVAEVKTAEPIEEAAPVEVVAPAEETAEAAIVTKEEVAAPEKVTPKVTAKKAKKSNAEYYKPDPYTDGGHLDLDGPDRRQKYLNTNVILVPKKDDKSIARKNSY